VVCPEQQVLRLPLKGAAKGCSPVILSPNCTNCGRCIDVCSKDVFTIVTRFSPNPSTPVGTDKPAL
jgi:ferredoxin-type protein NapH